MKIEIIEVSNDGTETVVNNQFVSPLDVAKALAMQASMGVMPEHVQRTFARDVESQEWIAEIIRR